MSPSSCGATDRDYDDDWPGWADEERREEDDPSEGDSGKKKKKDDDEPELFRVPQPQRASLRVLFQVPQ